MKFTSEITTSAADESGKCSIIDTTKGKVVSTEKLAQTNRNGVIEDREMNTNNTNMNGGVSSETITDNCSTREPEENGVSDSEDNSAKEPDENEDLSDCLSKCTISEKSPDEDEDVATKISNLTLDEKKEDTSSLREDDQFIEIKSCEIRSQDDEEECKDGQDVMTERGPHGGRPTTFQQNSYQQCQQQVMQGYQPVTNTPYGVTPNYGCNQQLYNQVRGQAPAYDSYQQMKRTRDDFEEQPIKFTRPVETKLNNLNEPPRNQNPNLNVVSKNSFSGGQVTVKSPEIKPLIQDFGAATTSGEYDVMSLFDQDTFIQECSKQGMFENICPELPKYSERVPHQNNVGQTSAIANQYLNQTNLNMAMEQQNRTSFSPETDLMSEGYNSDVASPCSDLPNSPPNVDQSIYSPPPLSVDSGTGSQMDGSSPRSTLTGYESNFDMYDPNSPLSPGNMSQSGSSVKQTIQVPQQNFQNQVQQSFQKVLQPQQNFQPDMNLRMNYPVSSSQMSSNLTQMSSNLPQMSSNLPPKPCPQVVQDQQVTSDFISNNVQDLFEVMQVIAKDLEAADKKGGQKAPPPPSKQVPINKTQIHPQQAVKTKPVASIPPNKASNPCVPTTSAPVLVVQQPQRCVPAHMNIPANATKGIPQASVNTSQILVLPSQPVVILTQQPVNQNNRKQTQFRTIQPKPPSAPGRVSTAEVKPPGMSSPRNGTRPVQPVGPVAVRPQKPKSPAPSKTSGHHLNYARRAVANFTTEDLKLANSDGQTYLHQAVYKTDKFLIQALLERILRENLQSLIDAQNSKRQTPVYLAVSSNQHELVELFVKFGADVNIWAERIGPNGKRDQTAAIHCAASNGREYLATLKELLKSQDLNLNAFNSDGYTALHCAILEHNQPKHDAAPGCEVVAVDSKPIIEALIRAGADPNAQDKKSGKTTFMYALESSDCTLIDTLIGLVDATKLRSYFRTQAFNGSTCVKIMEIRKAELPPHLYEKLTGIVSSSRSALNRN